MGDRVEVFALVGGLRGDLLFAGGVEARLEEIILQRIGPVLGDLLEGVLEFLVGEVLPLVEEFAELPEDLFDRLDIARVTVYEQFIAAGADAHIEKRFEVFDVLILYAE